MKKFALLILTVVLIMQTCSVFAYNLNEDAELKQKWDVFANKYSYDIELQDKVFFELYPKIVPSVAYHENSDGTADSIAIMYYNDSHAILSKETNELNIVKLSVNGDDKGDCIIFKGRTLVPATVFEGVGCKLVFDEKTLVTSISKDGNVVELMPYLLAMRKNGEEGYWVPLEICARYMGDEKEVYVPLRAIANELGLFVDWDNEARVAILNN